MRPLLLSPLPLPAVYSVVHMSPRHESAADMQ